MDIFKIIEIAGTILLPLFFVSLISLALILELTVFNFRTHLELNKISNLKSSNNKIVKHFFDNIPKENKLSRINFELQKIERKTSILSVVASISPMVGLLGTVFGMIKIFNQVSLQKPTNPLEALSGGISEALFATAGGLLVAIISGFAYHFLTSSLDSIEDKTLFYLNEKN
ncbi:MAG: MotA/TolQ/ExbB proton channel family protein [Candidatus Sericytochromatia bacterium]